MGICASVQYRRNQGRLLISNGPSSTAKVIHSGDGRLQEFRQPIRASNVISDQSNAFFLCNCETMFINCHVPHMAADEELQPGQIYFLMPISKSNKPFSLQELCSLAITASSALDKSSETRRNGGAVSFSRRQKSNRNAKANHEANFQLALKKLG
ncbi:uncharacterized protein LOC112506296 [Cynara cardunculus var. scolymus]|uniref:DUF4228 domain-containing protein n=1 Tax=Cynara cardunculus var. scolymus TaxID=59895 RepID=A0A103YKD1_CYNCS|nr:uncharacterized protein LOC112506296 [Cynara cardunculus var. scolymus]KVI10760.1 Protein of unknown function DUF4228 [Cynara cardunculus var. scolymus]